MTNSNRFTAALPKLKGVGGKAPAAPEPIAPPATEISPPMSSVAPSRKGKVVISAYFDPVVRQQLAIMAIRQEKSQAALMAEALNLLFERHGEPPIAKA
ncbi:ribbon-helix-helix domain-containing protein [Methylobacterium oryzihabitans]|uniref:Antitoxin-like ribbon-helix-helix domain-containing protein n=1 Tax=Methylobacterium oryzihabitans TaxID=2499852 RepID=A0A437NRE4_9HYPH|nr:ribbon-helix-helix domain-containing protein [Methylobacterium oryzihabitans]RVU12507.1 hypothetical protein EOE48_27880 [Methylobacterium oryzihabitans]